MGRDSNYLRSLQNGAMMKELKKAVNGFPAMITTEILDNMSPFWSSKNGIEVIACVMTAHRNVSKVQECGCGALGNLASNNDVNRVSIATKHGVEVIVSAMTAHSIITGVQECGCLAFFNLTVNESVTARIGLEGGVAVLKHNLSSSNVETALHLIKASINFG
jgi:hypothetical protein